MSGAALRAAVADHERARDLHATAVASLARVRLQRDAAAGRVAQAEAEASAAAGALGDGDSRNGLDTLRSATRALNEARAELQIIEAEALPPAIQKVDVLAASVDEASRWVVYRETADHSADREGAFTRAYAEMVAAAGRLTALAGDDDAAILAANTALPKGAARLLTLEARLRDAPRSPREVISAEPVKCWCFKRSGDRLREEMAAQVRDNGDGTGRLASAGAANASFGVSDVELRTFSRQVVRRERPAVRGDRVSTLEIPPLRRNRPAAEPVTEIVPADE